MPVDKNALRSEERCLGVSVPRLEDAALYRNWTVSRRSFVSASTAHADRPLAVRAWAGRRDRHGAGARDPGRCCGLDQRGHRFT